MRLTPQSTAPRILLHPLDAAPYRGKKFISVPRCAPLRGATRNSGSRVDRNQRQSRLWDNMGDRPVTSENWAIYEIAGEAGSRCSEHLLGLAAAGARRSLRSTMRCSKLLVEPAKPLASRGLQNLQALARVFGYIRYFHPSDEVASADWTRLAGDAIRAVEPAQTPAELAARLAIRFAVVAPTARIFPTGTSPPALNLTPGPDIISWRHEGVGFERTERVYRSIRAHRTGARGVAAGAHRLPGEVTLLMPMALYRDAYGPPIPAPVPQAKPGGFGDDRTTRLAACHHGLERMEHFYPYFDVVKTGLDGGTSDRSAGRRRRRQGRGCIWHHSAEGGRGPASTATAIVNPRRGGHQSAEFSGLGRDGRPLFFAASGVETELIPGDALVSIDGKPAVILGEIESLDSGATPQWVRRTGHRRTSGTRPRRQRST